MTEPNAQLMEEFRSRRTRQWIATGFAIFCILPFMLFSEGGPPSIAGLPQEVVAGIALAVIVALLVFSFSNWRCPSCEKYLGKTINPKFCARCGVQLRP